MAMKCISTEFAPSVIMKKFNLFIFLFLSMSSLSWAEVPELITDRPDQTESSYIVAYRHLQIESGWSYSHEDEDETKTIAQGFPSTLLRFGIHPRAELRLGWDGYQSEKTRAQGDVTRFDGGSDIEIGTKILLWEEKKMRPQTALLIHLSQPTGSDHFSTQRSDPSMRLNFSHSLTEKFSLGYNLGAQWESEAHNDEDRETLAAWIYTVSLGYSVSERIGGFIEFFGATPINARGEEKNSIDGGFTFLLMENVQLDVAVGMGLSSAAEDWIATMGCSIRLPQ